MFSFNHRLSSLELICPQLASRDKFPAILEATLNEKSRVGASRAILRVVVPKEKYFVVRANELGFRIEAQIPITQSLSLFVFAINDLHRGFCPLTLAAENLLFAEVIRSPRRIVNPNMDVVKLAKNASVIAALVDLFNEVYKDYPVSLDSETISHLFDRSIVYAVFENGKIVSTLFGSISTFDRFTFVELDLAATRSSSRSNASTLTLATAIEKEAIDRFGTPFLYAETIAGRSVMRTCYDFGMERCGILLNHTKIDIGSGKVYSNLHVWSRCASQ